jgi:HlyD family secretion protein
MKRLILLTPFIFILFSCSSDKDQADAYGNFETTETLVSAQGNGVLKQFEIQEGNLLHIGDTLGYIDTTDLHLKKEQLNAQVVALRSSLPEAGIQLQVIEQQLDHAQHEQKRLKRLLSDSAATQKQKDDMDAQVKLLQKKYASLKSSLSVQTQSILSKIKPLQVQVAQVKEKLQNYVIINPVKGIVLTKYAEPHELVSYGKPLYTIGDLSEMILRAYVTGNQLPKLKIGDTVTVRTDKPGGGYEKWNGIISWISSQSEFTPKEIQTKEERANRVYAIKILVKNDGRIKMGMPGEIIFHSGFKE